AVVVPEAPLRNRDRVVLQADGAAVVEHGDTRSIVMPGVVCLLAKRHVVFAETICGSTRIGLWHLMPERQLASSGAKVGAEDSPVVMPTRSHAHADSTSQRVVTRSCASTAMLVAAK